MGHNCTYTPNSHTTVAIVRAVLVTELYVSVLSCGWQVHGLYWERRGCGPLLDPVGIPCAEVFLQSHGIPRECTKWSGQIYQP